MSALGLELPGLYDCARLARELELVEGFLREREWPLEDLEGGGDE